MSRRIHHPDPVAPIAASARAPSSNSVPLIATTVSSGSAKRPAAAATTTTMTAAKITAAPSHAGRGLTCGRARAPATISSATRPATSGGGSDQIAPLPRMSRSASSCSRSGGSAPDPDSKYLARSSLMLHPQYGLESTVVHSLSHLLQMTEQVEEPLMGPMRPRLDRAHRDPQVLGDLDVGQPLEVAEPDYLPLLVAELLQGGANLEYLPNGVQPGGQDDGIDRVARDRTLAPAIHVDGGAAGDGVDPGGHFSTGV